MSRAAAEVGSTANSYQILGKLATGGMAEIFLARGEGVAGVERYCVLKRILRDRASDMHFVRMFLDEARLAAQLQHANIAQVYDIGKLGDSYFFTMEYVHGETVRALLHRAQLLGKPLPIPSVLTIAAGTAAGLHHAHDRLGLDGRPLGIVHRDVSPSNLMVSYEGGVKLVDFGVAKADDRSQETKSGTVKGKISYLSPEQCRGKRVDRRSDLFSLGICFWEMLTTERLFKRATDFENMNAIVTEDTPPPSTRRPEVPPELDELVMRLLAKQPEHRFQTADEVVDAIESVASRTGAMLSSSALGRCVREMFGQRPEPWRELEKDDGLAEAVTVTSEPVPHELAASRAGSIDRQLASVVDLGGRRPVTESIAAPELMPELDPGSPQIAGRLGLPLAAPPSTRSGAKRPGSETELASKELPRRTLSLSSDAAPRGDAGRVTATMLAESAERVLPPVLPAARLTTPMRSARVASDGAREATQSLSEAYVPGTDELIAPLPPPPPAAVRAAASTRLPIDSTDATSELSSVSVIAELSAVALPRIVDAAELSESRTSTSSSFAAAALPSPPIAKPVRRWGLYALAGGAAVAGMVATIWASSGGGARPDGAAMSAPNAQVVVEPIAPPAPPPVPTHAQLDYAPLGIGFVAGAAQQEIAAPPAVAASRATPATPAKAEVAKPAAKAAKAGHATKKPEPTVDCEADPMACQH